MKPPGRSEPLSSSRWTHFYRRRHKGPPAVFHHQHERRTSLCWHVSFKTHQSLNLVVKTQKWRTEILLLWLLVLELVRMSSEAPSPLRGGRRQDEDAKLQLRASNLFDDLSQENVCRRSTRLLAFICESGCRFHVTKTSESEDANGTGTGKRCHTPFVRGNEGRRRQDQRLLRRRHCVAQAWKASR